MPFLTENIQLNSQYEGEDKTLAKCKFSEILKVQLRYSSYRRISSEAMLTCGWKSTTLWHGRFFYHGFLPPEKKCNCILKQVWTVQSWVKQYDWLATKSYRAGSQMNKSFLSHSTGSPTSSGRGARAMSQIQDYLLHLLWQWKAVSQLLSRFKLNWRKPVITAMENVWVESTFIHP